MEIIRGHGRLTHPETGKDLAEVSYVINNQPPTKTRMGEWSGSLIVTYQHEQSWGLFNAVGENLKLKLDDGRSGKIIVSHWTPVPPDSPAQFIGTGPLE